MSNIIEHSKLQDEIEKVKNKYKEINYSTENVIMLEKKLSEITNYYRGINGVFYINGKLNNLLYLKVWFTSEYSFYVIPTFLQN